MAIVQTQIGRMAADCSKGDIAVCDVAGLGWLVSMWDGREPHDLGMCDTKAEALVLALYLDDESQER